MKFDYKAYEVQPFPGQPKPGVVFRPVVKLRILGTKSQIPFRGLIDTGADMTVIPMNIADFVGVAMMSSHPGAALGVGGEIEVAYGKVLLQIDFGKNEHRWCATVGVARESWTEAVLGHLGFVQFFDATFFGEQRVVELKRNKLPFEATRLPKP
jgi:hypothetical protein